MYTVHLLVVASKSVNTARPEKLKELEKVKTKILAIQNELNYAK